MAIEQSPSHLVELTVEVVSAYVGRNAVPAAELPALIGTVHKALQTVGTPAQTQEPQRLTPPMPIRKTVTPDFLISLEDGRRYRTLKRHLTKHGLTPQQYRQKWGLADDYPIVAPNYAAQRSEIARGLGFGQQRRKEAAKTAATSETVASEPPKKRGRKKAV